MRTIQECRRRPSSSSQSLLSIRPQRLLRSRTTTRVSATDDDESRSGSSSASNNNNKLILWLIGVFLLLTLTSSECCVVVEAFSVSTTTTQRKGGRRRRRRGSTATPKRKKTTRRDIDHSGQNGRQQQQKKNRYFTEHLIAPPLDPDHDVAATLGGIANVIGATADLDLVFDHVQSSQSELPITYTNDPGTVTQWLAEHVLLSPSSSVMEEESSSSSCCTSILGFDVESVPDCPWVNRKANFRGPATIQLATTDASLVIQLARKGSGRPSSACVPIIEAILRDPNIVKCGVGLDDDLIELRSKFRNLEARSRFELGLVGATRQQTNGLKSLTRFLLGLNLIKSKKTAMSDWSQVPLSETQILYSARDAWAGAAIADNLFKLDPDTFALPALVERLHNQPSLNELQRKRRTCKQARTTLSVLRASEPSSGNGRNFPSWKVELMRELRNVIHENKPQKGEIFDIALPFRTANPNNNNHPHHHRVFAMARNVSAW